MNKPKPKRVTMFEDWKYRKDLDRAERMGYPKYAVVKTKYDDTTANGLTRLIIAYCRAHGWHAERINTVGRQIDRRQRVIDCMGHERTIGGYEYIPTAGMKGSADIHILAAGRPIFCEVKIGRDRQRAAQKDFQKSVEGNGGRYIIVRSFDDFIEQVKTN